MQTAKNQSLVRINKEILQKAIDVGLNPSKVCENALIEMINRLARGEGFEPSLPFLTTDLAGLPPTRLGQPRKGVPV